MIMITEAGCVIHRMGLEFAGCEGRQTTYKCPLCEVETIENEDTGCGG